MRALKGVVPIATSLALDRGGHHNSLATKIKCGARQRINLSLFGPLGADLDSLQWAYSYPVYRCRNGLRQLFPTGADV